MSDVDIGLEVFCAQSFQLCVELRHSVLREQEEQVETQQLVPVGRLGQLIPVTFNKRRDCNRSKEKASKTIQGITC